MNHIPPGFEIRPFTDEDMPAAHALYLSLESVDGPVLRVSQEEMVHFWNWKRHVPEAALAAFEGGELAGYCMLTRQQTENLRWQFHIKIRAQSRRRGLGSYLLGTILEKGRARGIREFDALYYNTCVAGRRFAERHGFPTAAMLWRMDLLQENYRPGPGAHLAEVRSMRVPEDFALLAQMWNETFFEHFGFGPSTEEETRDSCGGPDFNPELVMFGELEGDTAGFCRAGFDSEGVGWIEVLGVKPAARGTGLGRYLMDRNLQAMFGRGATRAALFVIGHNEGAIQLYRKTGFTVGLEQHIVRCTV